MKFIESNVFDAEDKNVTRKVDKYLGYPCFYADRYDDLKARVESFDEKFILDIVTTCDSIEEYFFNVWIDKGINSGIVAEARYIYIIKNLYLVSKLLKERMSIKNSLMKLL